MPTITIEHVSKENVRRHQYDDLTGRIINFGRALQLAS